MIATLTNEIRQRMHTAVLAALLEEDIETGSVNTEFASLLADAVCLDDAGAETLLLAEAIDFFVYRSLFRSECDVAEIDATDMSEVYGAAMTERALRLAGFVRENGSDNALWFRPVYGPPRRKSVHLPSDPLSYWVRHHA